MAWDKTDKAIESVTISFIVTPAEPGKWDYKRAVTYAKGRLKISTHMTDERQWLDPTSRGRDMLASDPQTLLKDARLKADAFDALRFAIACKIERNEPLPEPVKAWAASFLRGEIDAPVKEAGTRTSSGKQCAILKVIDDLVKYGGLTASRNEAAKIKESACDAVAAALSSLHMEPTTFEGVRDLWKQRRKIAPDRFAE